MPAWCSSRTSSPASRSAPISAPRPSQKCVRAGGKHNDLDNVGYTARHHTFFEMLGNFSFGDYFKERAIELAWNLITKEFGLPKDKLTGHRLSSTTMRRSTCGRRSPACPTAGSSASPAPTISGRWATPARAARARRSSTTTATRFRAARPARRTRTATASSRSGISSSCSSSSCRAAQRVDLPRPSIDTGMGLERIAAVLQGMHDNYDIDLFRALIGAIAELTKVVARRRAEGARTASSPTICAPRAFLIADGVLPSNEGRGYVLRRIMRRAMRHAQLLGAREPLMWRLVPALVREMGQAYPELRARRGADHRDAEARGDALPQDAGARPVAPRRGDQGAQAAATCSTARPRSRSTTPIGFPLDLTQDALRPRGIGVDTDAFNAAMEQQKAKARALLGGLRRGRDRDRLVSDAREGSARPSSSATRPRRAEGVVTALVKRRQGGRRAEGRRDRRGRRQPDAVLRRVRRPGRRHRRDDGRRRALRASPTRRRRPATCSCITARSSRAR